MDPPDGPVDIRRRSGSMKSNKGFTLIELMIVTAIVAVLAAIALPAYQHYVARAQVAEGLTLAGAATAAVSDYYANKGDFPVNNRQAGMANPASIRGRYVDSVMVDGPGRIQVLFGGASSSQIHGQTLVMNAASNDGSLVWHCSGLDGKYLPAPCR